MGIVRATRYDEVGVRNLLRSGRHVHADFGAEDLPSLLARETAVVGKDRTVWGFAAVQIEDRPASLPASACTRAHVRAVALSHGMSPAQRVPELMVALLEQLAADGDPLQVLSYGGEPWLAGPLLQVGFGESGSRPVLTNWRASPAASPTSIEWLLRSCALPAARTWLAWPCWMPPPSRRCGISGSAICWSCLCAAGCKLATVDGQLSRVFGGHDQFQLRSAIGAARRPPGFSAPGHRPPVAGRCNLVRRGAGLWRPRARTPRRTIPARRNCTRA